MYDMHDMVYGAQTSCSVHLGEQNAADSQAWVGDPINSRNGNLSYQVMDLSIPIRGCALEFRRSYASDAVAVYTGTLGHGWTHNYDMRLHFTGTTLSDTVEVQAANGSRLPFYDHGDDTFAPYAGVTAEMQQIGSTYVITGANQKVYTFDTQGLLQEQRDPYGNVITFTYNANNQLIRAAQNERYLDYAYDGNGRLTTVTDNLGRAVEVAYSNDNLTVVTNTLELETQYYYSATHQSTNHAYLLTQVVDPSGVTVMKTAYDAQDRAYRQWDGQDKLLVDINYVITNTRVVTLSGVVITHTYDARNTLVNTVYACTDGTTGCGTGSGIAYDGSIRQNMVQDANGNPVNMVWDASGSNLEHVADALGNHTALSYDAYNNLTQVVNARDVTTTYRYDNAAFPTFLTRMTDGLDKTTYYTSTTTADGVPGLLKQEEDPEGRIITYQYNGFGQVTEIVRAAGSPDAVTTGYGYDVPGTS